MLKRWYKSRLKDMNTSLTKLADAKAEVEADPKLAKYLDVVGVREQVADWIVRGFVEKSKPIGDATGPAQRIRAEAIAALKEKASRSATEKDILKKLERESDHLHWSAERSKIVFIDMQ